MNFSIAFLQEFYGSRTEARSLFRSKIPICVQFLRSAEYMTYIFFTLTSEKSGTSQEQSFLAIPYQILHSVSALQPKNGRVLPLLSRRLQEPSKQHNLPSSPKLQLNQSCVKHQGAYAYVTWYCQHLLTIH